MKSQIPARRIILPIFLTDVLLWLLPLLKSSYPFLCLPFHVETC